MSDSASQPAAFGSRTTNTGPSNEKWWPEQLNLKILHPEHPNADPLGPDFDYRQELEGLDIEALTRDVDAVMTDSQDWWPADFGHYGGLFIRMAWHSAGTYRVMDGRGGAGSGAQRFAPLNSWPDNVNLDRARRLLWPVKQKYGRQISWADLLIFTGNRALETMGLETFGFAFGRRDVWAPEEDVFWGPEDEWLDDQRYTGDRELNGSLAAVQMGLIYVNPEGPNGVPDALKAAHDIRVTFARMAMNDEETVALIAGGHTFGKAHGAAPESNLSDAPEGGPLAAQGLGWTNEHGTGTGPDAITSGLEGSWTSTPVQWSNDYFKNIFKYEWELTESPAGAKQWTPKGGVDEADLVPDAHDPAKKHPPMMFTTDLALVADEAYLEISKRFHEDNAAFADAFSRAWFKLTHRDMGPKERYLGPLVPDEELLWQDPVPAVDHDLVDAADVAELKAAIVDSGLSDEQLIVTAWNSASTFRITDKRGGADGARIRLSPQADWDINIRSGVATVIAALEQVQDDFNGQQSGSKKVSLADLIVLGGAAGIERAAKAAGREVEVPFTPGRTDASQDQTDVDSFQYLEPKADAFRNYLPKAGEVPAEHLMLDRAHMLTLSAPQMTALIGGLRVLGTNVDGTQHGVLTDRPGQLTNDFFVNLIDMGTTWEAVGEGEETFEGRDRATGETKWTATRVDLVFGSNSQLRAISEVYGSSDHADAFVDTFVQAWTKVMEADRYDVHGG